MALPLLRCLSSTLPAPFAGESVRRTSGRTRASSEKVVLLLDQEPKVVLLVDRPETLAQKCKISWDSHSRQYSKLNIAEDDCGTDSNSSGFDLIVKYMSEHQRMASFFFPKALAAINSLMLVLPSKALAETCEVDDSLFNMPLLFAIAMIGATVGGLLARQRKGELKKLNDQLRQINAALRRQAKIESYAPNLSYAPVGSRLADADIVVDPNKEELISKLRAGKTYLRNQSPERAFNEFKAALQLAQDLEDHVEQKKAARGLGASLQRQGKYKEAIKYHTMVLNVSKKAGEESGITEAYGAIADCYTELGELEQAGKFYDKYIARLEND